VEAILQEQSTVHGPHFLPVYRLAEISLAQLKMAILIKLWILVSAACVAAGWILSGLHELNSFGYAAFFAAAGLGFGLWVRRRGGPGGWQWHGRGWMRRWRRRFSRLLPMIYALAVLVVIFGGAIYPPRNYDALTYRVPRILHWWTASGWHWIQTPNDRMNLSGTGFEWLMLPLFAVSHSDRLFFLINVAAFLLMPGLVYGVFAGLGVPRRAAWYWMWLLPMGLCYIMQAGSIGNDSYAVTYLLAAIWFGLRAVRTGRVSDLWLAILSGALLTGVKGSNLPLPLAVGWAIWPALKLARLRPISSLLVFVVAVAVSYVPTAWFNNVYTGHWTGDPFNADKLQAQTPWVGIVGNSLQLAAQSLEPPFFPMAKPAQAWVWDHLPDGLHSFLGNGFPHFSLGFRELPQEEASGLGLGVTIVALLALFGSVAAWRSKPRRAWPPAARRGLTIGLLAWLSLLAYMVKLGSESTGRLLAAYYPLLLLPFLVHPSQAAWARKRWRHLLAACVGVTALVVLILSPARPLWPAHEILGWLSAKLPGNELFVRGQRVYDVYACRNDAFAGLRAQIPDSVSTIGVINDNDDMESSLWRPFGRRAVVDLVDVEHAKPPNIEWVVVKNELVTNQFQSFEQWTRHAGGTLISSQMIVSKVHVGPEEWSLLRFTGTARRKGRLRSGEHTRPRVSPSAPSPMASPNSIENGGDARMCPARAPAATREGARAPLLHRAADHQQILADGRRADLPFQEVLQRKDEPVKAAHRGRLEIPLAQEAATDQPAKITGKIIVADLFNLESRAGQLGGHFRARVAAIVSELAVDGGI
jgi:hypothetical protein